MNLTDRLRADPNDDVMKATELEYVANAIAHLIGVPDISGEHYTPEWCQKHFT